MTNASPAAQPGRQTSLPPARIALPSSLVGRKIERRTQDEMFEHAERRQAQRRFTGEAVSCFGALA